MWVVRYLIALLIAALPFVPQSARADGLTIYAASSLRGVLDELGTVWQAQGGDEPTLVYAGSSALARQVQAGAPADLVILANIAWMDALEQSGDLQDNTRRDLWTNRLVVIGTGPDAEPIDLANPDALPERLGQGRLALALTEAVPVGIYAREALEHMGLWPDLSPRAVEADNARAALALVAIGAADLGVVYATDAGAEPRVRVLAEIPSTSHSPIRYPAAALSRAAPDRAEAFLAFLDSPAAREIAMRHGFGLIGER